jgi:hypothetical protein
MQVKLNINGPTTLKSIEIPEVISLRTLAIVKIKSHEITRLPPKVGNYQISNLKETMTRLFRRIQ